MAKKTNTKPGSVDSLRVGFEDQGRLDRFLVDRFSGWSRTRLQRLIEKGGVTVDGQPAQPNHQVRTGQTVRVEWPKPAPAPVPSSEPLPFPILFEDDTVIAVNKPAGLVVHPSAGHHDGGTLVELLRPRVAGGPWPEEIRPGLVHRLDRDTSGVIILAKTPGAQDALSRQFSERQAKKTYLAIARGRLPAEEGTLESNIGRHPGQRQKFAVSSSGRWSSTRFRVLERFGDRATLVELRPLTGRTHQIRVHLAGYGHPIIGDGVYGGTEREWADIPRQMLHAASLELMHPKTGRAIRFEAPLPSDFQDCLKVIRSPL